MRANLVHLLESQGFVFGNARSFEQRSYDKETIRSTHRLSREERLASETGFLQEWFPLLSQYFASGTEVEPSRIDPVAIVVENDEMAALFRLASLWWSVPVSKGFGRRFRILVFDRSNGKLIGLLGLTDPVFNLSTRDQFIGWDVRERERRLVHVMDAHVLGAVPPYNALLGAKLVALIATSDFVRGVFKKRYADTHSIIRRREFDGRLALVTATSALGRSSVLNRVRFEGVSVFQDVGFTKGFGHFHLANGTYAGLCRYLSIVQDDEVERFRFGEGPNYRFRVVRRALEHLGLPADMLRHGIQRAVYVAPLAKNTSAFLRGEHERLYWHRRPIADVIETWRERWMLPRAERNRAYKTFDKEDWKHTLGLSS